jgi:hypothetical protein
MFKEEQIDRYDYECLASCPFCEGRGLSSDESDNCPHFVVAFQEGGWGRSLCPPVWCNGFLYSRNNLKRELQELTTNVVRRIKSGTRRHPRIEAIFCADPRTAQTLREKHKKPRGIRPGNHCPECGTQTTVCGEFGDLVCAACGASCGAHRSPPLRPVSWIN